MRFKHLAISSAAVILLSNWANSAFAQGASFVVGGKNYTEQLILAEVTTQLLQAKGLTVTKQDGLASSLLRQAQENGEVDLYWEYTGTSLVAYNKVSDRLSPEETYARVKALDGEKGLVWLAPSTANNTYAIALRAETAGETKLKTLSDLAAAVDAGSNYKLATDAEFSRREDGLPGLQEAYGFTYRRTNLVLMDPGLTYEALRQRRVETAVVLSTDGRVRAFEFVLLQDDKRYFPSYILAPVVRQDTLKRIPELEAVLNGLSARLTEDVLRGLNAQVDVDKNDVRQVATSFLKKEQLLP